MNNPSYRLLASDFPPTPASRQDRIAGLIAYAIYSRFQLREGYWAVFTALIVTQANLGASWQAALYRTIGTTAGAVSAALLAALIGPGPIRTGVLLFVLAAVFAFLTAAIPASAPPDSPSLWSCSSAILTSTSTWPGTRVLYTVMGALIAFLVGVLVWPIRAREGLKAKIALLLGRLRSPNPHGDRGGLERKRAGGSTRRTRTHPHPAPPRHHARPGRSSQRTGPLTLRSRCLRIVRRGTGSHPRPPIGLSGDTVTYAASAVAANLVPSLPALCQQISEALAALGDVIAGKGEIANLDALQKAVTQVDQELTALRQARATSPLALDHMLPFWSFVFNLKETAAGIENLRQKLPQLD